MTLQRLLEIAAGIILVLVLYLGCPGNDMTEPVDVVLEDFKFIPDTLTVDVNEEVIWEHRQGNVSHTVTSNMGLFDSREGDADARMKGDDKFRFKFNETGIFAYSCVVHVNSGMVGVIIVVNNKNSMDATEKLYHVWYSNKQFERFHQDGYNRAILEDGTIVTYTEMIYSKNIPGSNFDDFVYLGHGRWHEKI